MTRIELISGVKSQPILIVEDSEDDFEATMRAFMKANLHNPIDMVPSGGEARTVCNHEGAFRMRATKPGLILLDLNMPGMDGRKTLEIIKKTQTEANSRDDPDHVG